MIQQGSHQGCVAMATGSFAGLWDVLPCTNKEKYICKHLVEGAVLPPPPPTVPSTTCEIGWSKIYKRNFCYKVKLSSLSLLKMYFKVLSEPLPCLHDEMLVPHMSLNMEATVAQWSVPLFWVQAQVV